MFVHHIAVTVNNLDESIKFYQDVFGFKLKDSFIKGNSKFAYIKLEGFTLELWEFTEVKVNNSPELLEQIGLSHLAFGVEDIDEAVKSARLKGVMFSEPKLGVTGRRYSLGKDCNGISLELLEITN